MKRATRQRGWTLLTGTLLLAGCGGGGSGAPNVILISIDTLRPDHLGCYGSGTDVSPWLDDLAARGALYEDCLSPAPWTLPGHASMLTGLYPSHHGVKDHNNRLPEEIWTLAEELDAVGYDTLAVVNSWNIGELAFDLDQGFDEADFRYVEETEPDPDNPFLKRVVNRGPEIVDQAKELIEGHGENPFFMFLHFYDVHTDFTAEEPYREKYVSPYGGRLDGRTRQLVEIRNLIMAQEQGLLGTDYEPERLDEADVRFLKEMYDAEIRQLDDLLARFFEWLGERVDLDNTLVVVTSDHGEEYFEHGSVLHGRTQYQEVLAIPLVLAGPGVPVGERVGTTVSLVDVVPTILGCLGLTPRGKHDGLDLSAPWRGGDPLPEMRPFFGEADHNNVVNGRPVVDVRWMIRLGDEKIIYDRPSERLEFYDLSEDPLEQNNLGAQREARVKRLMRSLRRFRDSAIEPQYVEPPSAEDLETLRAAGYLGEVPKDR